MERPARLDRGGGSRRRVAVPFGGSPATDAFCDISRTASQALLRFLDHPVRFGIVFAVGGDRRWWPSSATRRVGCSVLRRTRTGAIRRASCRSAAHPVRRRGHPRSCTGSWCATRRSTTCSTCSATIRRGRRRSSPRSRPIVTLPVMAWVLAATVELVVDTDRRAIAARVRGGCRRLPLATFLTSLVLVVAFGVGTIVLLLLPLVALVASRWLVAPVVCADQVVPARAGLRRSAALLRGQPAARHRPRDHAGPRAHRAEHRRARCCWC